MMTLPTTSGPRVIKLRELDSLAYTDGSAEGRVSGLGVVHIVKLAPSGARVARSRFQRYYLLDGNKTTAAALYAKARELDAGVRYQAGDGTRFDTLAEARAYTESVARRTNVILSIEEVQS